MSAWPPHSFLCHVHLPTSVLNINSLSIAAISHLSSASSSLFYPLFYVTCMWACAFSLLWNGTMLRVNKLLWTLSPWMPASGATERTVLIKLFMLWENWHVFCYSSFDAHPIFFFFFRFSDTFFPVLFIVFDRQMSWILLGNTKNNRLHLKMET